MTELSRRAEDRLCKALQAVKIGGQRIRSAARKFRVNRSTLSKYKKRGSVERHQRGRPPMLNKRNEELLVNMLVRHAQRGIPRTQAHLVEAIRELLRSMSPAQRHVLGIRDVNNYQPSASYLLSFRYRHRAVLKFGRPTPQEGKRFRAVNAESIANHFATLHRLLSEFDLAPTHILNLDECGVTPQKDCLGRVSSRRLFPTRSVSRSERTDIAMPEFSYTHRVTMMPVVSASGEVGPPLFVFPGNRFQFELHGGEGRPVTHRLQANACVATRESVGGVDSTNFLSWAHHFLRHTSDLRANGRKVLLVYDGYRAHLSLAVLELFYHNGVIVYALPSHTSGKLQPLDCCVFSSFKAHLKSIALDMVVMDDDRVLDQADLCAIMCAAYEKAFTRENIKSGFRHAGLYQLDNTRVTCQPRPASSAIDAPILTVEHLEERENARRLELRFAVLGDDARFCRSGWVDTSNGCVMNAPTVIEMVRTRANFLAARDQAIKEKALRKELKAARSAAKSAADIARLKHAQIVRRASQFGESVSAFVQRVRPMRERIAIAKMRTQNRI